MASAGSGAGAVARGGAAGFLLAVGIVLLASGLEIGYAVPVGTAAAGLGAVWLALEWGFALRRARTEARASERLRAERNRLRSEKAGLEQEYGEIRSEQAQLVNSTRLATLGSLVAGIAHELDTPLGSLRSNHDTLRRALSKLQTILEDQRVDEP
jgi:signal transduction histidine kinase